MTYVITQPCIGLKDASCVEVCPVDCIYEGEEMYYIHPDECIECAACEPECPVEAIFAEEDVPPEWRHFIQVNADINRQMVDRAVALLDPQWMVVEGRFTPRGGIPFWPVSVYRRGVGEGGAPAPDFDTLAPLTERLGSSGGREEIV